MKRTLQIGLLTTLAAALLVGLSIPASAQRDRGRRPQAPPTYAPPGQHGGPQQWQPPGRDRPYDGGAHQWQPPRGDCPRARPAPPVQRVHPWERLPSHRSQFGPPWGHSYGPPPMRPYHRPAPRGGDWRHGGGHGWAPIIRRHPRGCTPGGYHPGRW